MYFAKVSLLLLSTMVACVTGNNNDVSNTIPSPEDLEPGMEVTMPGSGRRVLIKEVRDRNQLHRSLAAHTIYTNRADYDLAIGGPYDYLVTFAGLTAGDNWRSSPLTIPDSNGNDVWTFEMFGSNPGVTARNEINSRTGTNGLAAITQVAYSTNMYVELDLFTPACAWGADLTSTNSAQGAVIEVDVECPGGTMTFTPPHNGFWGIVIDVETQNDAIDKLIFKAAGPGTSSQLAEVFTIDDVGVWNFAAAKVMGDPHIQTWSGDWYDFHGQCDLVYLNNPSFGGDDGLTVHIRTSPRYSYSYIESAAIKIGDDVLQVGSWGQYFVNGVENTNMFKMAGKYTITHTEANEKRHVFEVDLLQGQKLVVSTNKDMVAVTIEKARQIDFGTSAGLLGKFVTGERLGRDGTTVITDDNLFGQEWQVLSSEPKLFLNSRTPQHPLQCTMPDPSKAGTRRLGQSIAEEAAKLACAHWGGMQEQCVFDVMAFGDLDLAEAPPGAY